MPWGTGCTIVYNYVDLQLRNDTDVSYQLRFEVSTTHLHGVLRASAHPEHAYRVEARNEVFYRCGEQYFRANELWRTAPSGGDDDPGEKVRTNCALVKYMPTDVAVVDIDLGIG